MHFLATPQQQLPESDKARLNLSNHCAIVLQEKHSLLGILVVLINVNIFRIDSISVELLLKKMLNITVETRRSTMSVEIFRKTFFPMLVICLAVLIVPTVVTATPSPPMALIQAGTDRALQILRSSQAGTAPSLRDRRAEILQVVDEYFNFHEMAKRALGHPWKQQPKEKQQEFVKLFKQLLFNTYIEKVETYTGSNEKFAYDQEKIEGEYAQVKTRVIGYKNTDVQVDYRLRLEDGKWKAYDVIVEGISLVNNYRQQFESILSGGSFDTLLSRMREKIAGQGK